jgi:hypothetical protein
MTPGETRGALVARRPYGRRNLGGAAHACGMLNEDVIPSGARDLLLHEIKRLLNSRLLIADAPRNDKSLFSTNC